MQLPPGADEGGATLDPAAVASRLQAGGSSVAAAAAASVTSTDDSCSRCTSDATSQAPSTRPTPAATSPHSTVELSVDPFASQWSPFKNTSAMTENSEERTVSAWQAATRQAAQLTAQQCHTKSDEVAGALTQKSTAGSGVAVVFATGARSDACLSCAEWETSRAQHEAAMRSAVSEQQHELVHPSAKALADRAKRKTMSRQASLQQKEQRPSQVPGKRTSIWHMKGDGSPTWPSQQRWQATQPAQPRIQKNATSPDFKLG